MLLILNLDVIYFYLYVKRIYIFDCNAPLYFSGLTIQFPDQLVKFSNGSECQLMEIGRAFFISETRSLTSREITANCPNFGTIIFIAAVFLLQGIIKLLKMPA